MPALAMFPFLPSPDMQRLLPIRIARGAPAATPCYPNRALQTISRRLFVVSSTSVRGRADASRMSVPAASPLILIVEDFDDAREMYRDYLEFSGFRVETARDGREAIEKARALQPDLILMDLSLPGIDGWEATRLLKAEPDTSHLLIVALSAHALAAEGDRARAAGCDGFIAKPCLPSDLVHEIGVYLKGQAASRERRARPRRH